MYRTLDKTSGAQYSTSGNFFGEPDEEVGDAEETRREERRIEVSRKMMVEKGKKRFLTDDDDDDDLVIQPPSVLGNSTPSKFRRLATPPPSSPTRLLRATTPRSPLGKPFEQAQVFPTFSSAPFLSPLHPSLASLLALYVSLESTLICHLANEGSGFASTTSKTDDAGVSTIRIPNLITLPKLAKLMATDGKKLGEKELSRLLWVWEGCGLKEDANEGDEDELNIEIKGEKERGGMGFLVSQTRCNWTNTIVNTHGIGISVSIKSNPQLPQFELIAPPSSPTRGSATGNKVAPASPSSIGRGREGMSVVALWSAGKSDRRMVFAARLRKWAERCEAEEKVNSFLDNSSIIFWLTLPSFQRKSASQLPTPKRSRPSSPLDPLSSSPKSSLPSYAFNLPPIPQAALPSLSNAVPRIPGTSSPSPKKKTTTDFFGPAVAISTGGGTIKMLLEGVKVKVSTMSKGDQKIQDLKDRVRLFP